MSTFIAKLNYKEEGYHLTQTFTVDSSTESVTIEHDYPTNIVIVDELDRVKVSNVDYSLVPTEGKPWEINIIPIGDYTTPETWTIEYESTGDENDADDINEVHEVIGTLNQQVEDLSGEGRTTETVKGNADAIANLAGEGRTTETVKGNADAIAALAGEDRTTETVKGNADAIAALADAHSTHLAEHSYLQEEEPTNVNPTTLWFAIGSEVNFSGGGVAIQNAETSDTPPETNIWFKPI
jgi:hypothetical protein